VFKRGLRATVQGFASSCVCVVLVVWWCFLGLRNRVAEGAQQCSAAVYVNESLYINHMQLHLLLLAVLLHVSMIINYL
jgi:hypothetical protein